jgi:hypothetical protein
MDTKAFVSKDIRVKASPAAAESSDGIIADVVLA